MIYLGRQSAYLIMATACLVEAACVHRPATTPTRMVEPQLIQVQMPQTGGLPQGDAPVSKAPTVTPIRLMDTESRGHIGRPVLHQEPNGELTEDPVWRWSSAPDQYLDTALRLGIESSPDMRLVDSGHVATLAATLVVWDLDQRSGQMRLTGAVEFQITGTDRAVHTHVVHISEPVSAELPGDLAVIAGRVMHDLVSEGLAWAAQER
jgi:hypothetical protein